MARLCVAALTLIVCVPPAAAQTPPWDLWSAEVRGRIRDQTNLDISLTTQPGYWDVFFTSNPSATWFDHQSPWEERSGQIRIHAFLAVPFFGGPHPALVLGHGHTEQADRTLAQAIAALGYVVLAIDGPRAGQSTGGPADHSQAWISVDQDADRGFLYHYAYAGMRALTVLEALAERPGNPFRIDTGRMGVVGASMGGMLATMLNGVDDRVRAAIILASAGNWEHSLRYPDSWLYNSVHAETRDLPYNGQDPLNSVEDIDWDPTTIRFLQYFDPIRYALRQHAPVLTVIGTHDEYFPVPSANLMQQAIQSAGARADFEKRLWLLPDTAHAVQAQLGSLTVVLALRQWFEYCFGNRSRPPAQPEIALEPVPSGLRIAVTLAEPPERLAGLLVTVHAATRIDTTRQPLGDFRAFSATREGNRFVALIAGGAQSPAGDTMTAENLVCFATVTDTAGLTVSSLMYHAGRILDLSSGFTPVIRHIPTNSAVVPLPPPRREAGEAFVSLASSAAPSAYQGLALTNPTPGSLSARLEARSTEGRQATGEGLIQPQVFALPARAQQVFVNEEWFGPGARALSGGFRIAWSAEGGAALAFRGDLNPPQLEGIGPLVPGPGPLWLPLAAAQDPGAPRRIRVFAPSGSSPVAVDVVFRNASGATLETRSVSVPTHGSVELQPPGAAASAQVRAAAALAARLEVTPATGDPWSIEAARAGPAGAAQLVQPHVEWNGIFTTHLLVINPDSVEQSVQFRLLLPDNTAATVTANRTLAAGGTLSETVDTLFGLAGVLGGAGRLVVEGSGGVLAVALAVDGTAGAAAASALQPSAAGTWTLPFFVEDSLYYTGLALAAAGNGFQGTMTAYSRLGAVLAQAAVALPAGQSRTALVSQWLPGLPGGATGYLVIDGAQAVSVLAYFGTLDGRALAAIPPHLRAP